MPGGRRIDWCVIHYCMVGFGAVVNAVKILVFEYFPPSRMATGGPGAPPCHCLGSGITGGPWRLEPYGYEILVTTGLQQ